MSRESDTLDGMRHASQLCDAIAKRYAEFAGNRDNPDAPLDSAFAMGAEACQKAILTEIASCEAAWSPQQPEPIEDDIPF